MPTLCRVACICFCLNATLCWSAQPRPLEFNRDIRPILSDHCFACHGPDPATREADMRLDTEHGLFASDAAPVVRGDAAASPLVQRITSDDVDERMPPAEFGKDLSPEQIDILQQWVAQGAPWQGHWSFQPIRRPLLPRLSPQPHAVGTTPANPVDAFVTAQLINHGLTLSPTADRRTLARRLHFDLLGLPASAAAVERFAQSNDPLAYEQLVDELLASAHFGERMAMWWLDLVRYADSVGYHGDQPVSVSPFRDYVIAAFNDNMPFDQFTIEQLAGDLLPAPTSEQMIAAGYNRLGMMSAEGGVQPKEYLAKYMAERVRNLGGTWLGVTLGCCECHDHKYDPFSAKEFYQFAAFFADIEERGLYSGIDWGPKISVPNASQQQHLDQLDADIAAQRDVLHRTTPELPAEQVAWEAEQTATWQPLTPAHMQTTAGSTLTQLADGSILASGESPANDTYTLTFDTWPQGITAIRIDALPHESLPHNGPGRAGNGNFVLSEFEMSLVEGDSVQPIALQNASATYEQTGAAGKHPDKRWSAASAIDGDTRGATWGWAIMEQVGQANSAVFELAPGSELVATENAGASHRLRIVLKQQLDNPRHTLGHFGIQATSAPLPVNAQQLLPTELAPFLKLAADQRTAEQAEQLAEYYRSIAPALAPAREQLKQLEASREQFAQTIPTMLVTQTVEPRVVRVLARGNWMDDSGPQVYPGIAAALAGSAVNAAAEASSESDADADPVADPDAATTTATTTDAAERRLNRMDLARWVVSPENPLTARVTVNRLWKQFFGSGLSAKLDDLGAQGEWPSHPLLLDWLADEFRSSGWDVKHIVKLIVMSQAYRQASLASPEIQAADPYNRLLSHQGRWRVDAEVVRDTLLASGGLLVDSVGGQSVKPYQPAGYWAYLNFPPREWHSDHGQALYRRGLYTHWQRQYLHPSLLAFDAPSREECTADRPRSNTPLQALVLLNDPSYVEAARALALRTLIAADDDPARIEWMLHTVLARSPRPAELPVLNALLEKHRAEFAALPDTAQQLLDVGELPLPDQLDGAPLNVTELAAWTNVARTLLNLHETITRN